MVECVEDQTADFVRVGIDQRLLDNFFEGQIGELAFRSDAFAFRPRSDASQLVARFLLIGLGEQLAKIGE